jgi:D-beta-D-heptose 7-phosphate kinase/D-beta-D-heptose 1-phosphate adenosyltransferase
MISSQIEVDSTALIATLHRCTDVSIAVVGDLMLDEYVDGVVERISPEAPVPIVRAAGSEFRLGGAANVARQITALGATVTLVGIVGDDAAGDTIRQLCQASGISTHSILTSHRQTTRKLRVLSQSQQLLRLDWEDHRPSSDAESAALVELMRDASMPDSLILSDYAKGVLTPRMIAGLMAGWQHPTRTIVVDPKHRDFTRYRGAKILTPNLRELSDATERPLDPTDLPGIAAAARSQVRKGGFDAFIVTLGGRGMLVVSADDSEILIPALKRPVYDVTGAGDTVAAVLTACMATGASIIAAARIANTAAGIAVGQVGAIAVPASRIADALLGRPLNKVLSKTELQGRVGQWRASGQRIVFTNGCFDLLHPGHLSLLHFAKSLGDILVLAINSDAAVSRLKGPSLTCAESRM